MHNPIPIFEMKPQLKSKAEYIVRLLQPVTPIYVGFAPMASVLSALQDTVCSLVSTCVRVMYELLLSTHAIWVFPFNHHNRLPIAGPWGEIWCLWWVQTLLYIIPEWLHCCIMSYSTLLWRHLTHAPYKRTIFVVWCCHQRMLYISMYTLRN